MASQGKSSGRLEGLERFRPVRGEISDSCGIPIPLDPKEVTTIAHKCLNGKRNLVCVFFCQNVGKACYNLRLSHSLAEILDVIKKPPEARRSALLHSCSKVRRDLLY